MKKMMVAQRKWWEAAELWIHFVVERTEFVDVLNVGSEGRQSGLRGQSQALARVLGWKMVPLTETVMASKLFREVASVWVMLRLRGCQHSSEDSIGCRSFNVLP